MKLNGARIIIETLIEQGADTVFGYPGGQVLNIFDELYMCSDRITNITIREAFRTAISGRPGPVLIDVPKDIQASECEFTPQTAVKKLPPERADLCSLETRNYEHIQSIKKELEAHGFKTVSEI